MTPDLDAALEKTLDDMSDEDLYSFIPIEAARCIAKGFLAGMLGPKKYTKNSWLSLDLDPRLDILPSFKRHIDQCESGDLDPDTGLADIEIFVGARAIMYITQKTNSRTSYSKDRKKIARYKNLDDYKHIADNI